MYNYVAWTIKKILRQEFQGVHLYQFAVVVMIALLGVIWGVKTSRIKKAKKNILLAFFTIIYAGFLVIMTLVRREAGQGSVRIWLDLSFYHMWGNALVAVFSTLNIIFFVPWGFLLRLHGKWEFSIRAFIKTMLIGIFTSAFIEFSQLATYRGILEAADLVNNTIGCFVGDVIGICFIGISRHNKTVRN